MVDRFGLITENQPNLLNFQRKLAQPLEHVESWADAEAMISLTDVVKHAKPTVLIGVSGQPGLFTQEVVEAMAENSVQPIIFPLSNPSHIFLILFPIISAGTINQQTTGFQSRPYIR